MVRYDGLLKKIVIFALEHLLYADFIDFDRCNAHDLM